MAIRPVFGPRPSRYQDFETVELLRGENVKFMLNRQPGGSEYLSLFGHLDRNQSDMGGHTII
jgi:hypothetical protein